MHTYAGKDMHKRDNVGNRGIRNISLWRQREEADNMVFGPKEKGPGSSLTVASMCIFMPTILWINRQKATNFYHPFSKNVCYIIITLFECTNASVAHLSSIKKTFRYKWLNNDICICIGLFQYEWMAVQCTYCTVHKSTILFRGVGVGRGRGEMRGGGTGSSM